MDRIFDEMKPLIGRFPVEALEVPMLAISGKILRPRIDFDPLWKPYVICDDPGEILSKYSESGAVFWQDIKLMHGTQDISRLYSLIGKMPSKDFDFLEDWWNQRAFPIIFESCSDFISESFASEITADLFSFMAIRMQIGKGDAHTELMLQLYDSGVMPAGWSGDYPSGSMVLLRRVSSRLPAIETGSLE